MFKRYISFLLICIFLTISPMTIYALEKTPHIDDAPVFSDIPNNAYYYDPVQWAVRKGITSGISNSFFGPNIKCTRAQVVTFLWKALDAPSTSSRFFPFSDVDKSSYYYDPVVWAASNEISKGTSCSTFSPHDPITRGQAMTFLWIAVGKPENTSPQSFQDVSPNKYYYVAVNWAKENNITSGTGEKLFSPNATCTRAQIITFLYKALYKENDLENTFPEPPFSMKSSVTPSPSPSVKPSVTPSPSPSVKPSVTPSPSPVPHSNNIYRWDQIPPPVKRYIEEVTYDSSDYSVSYIANYAPVYSNINNTWPIGQTITVHNGILERNKYKESVVAGNVSLYNDIPNQNTYFEVTNNGNVTESGILIPTNTLRLIKCPKARNVRDLGGWTCQNGQIRYGKIIRGGAISTLDRAVLVEQCGVRYELSLVGDGDEVGVSILGDDVKFQKFNKPTWYSLSNKELWHNILKVVFECASSNSCLYIHCEEGCDRTGVVASIIEAILGVSESDISKDYELSCFSTGLVSANTSKGRSNPYWIGFIDQIKSFSGKTFQDKVISFVKTCGFTNEEIICFQKCMINQN